MMAFSRVILLAVVCFVAVNAAPRAAEVEDVVEALKDVREKLKDEMDSLDELLNEAEEAPQEEPERRSWEERRSRDHDIDRRWDNQFTCGGSSGRQQWSDRDYAHKGRITAFNIWHEKIACYIEGIQVKYGDEWAPAHNDKLFKPEVSVHFAADEYITGVNMDKRNEWGTEVVCKITIHTNKRVYGPYCGYRCDNIRCGYTEWGNFRYISGRNGRTLDSLTFHEWYD